MEFIEKSSGVSSPFVGDVHVNQPLTQLATKWLMSQEAYISDKAYNSYVHTKKTDIIPNFDHGDWMRDDGVVKASDGSVDIPKIGFGLGDDTFANEVYHSSTVIGRQMAANADSWVKPMESATEFLTQRVNLFMEKKCSVTTDSAFWPSANRTDLTNKYNDDSDPGNPIIDSRGFQEDIWLNGQQEGVSAIMSNLVKNDLLDHPTIISRILGGATKEPGKIAKTYVELLASLMELDNIYIQKAVRNTADIGDTESFEYFNSNDMVYYHRRPENAMEMLMPVAVICFKWSLDGEMPDGIGIRTWWDDKMKQMYIIAEMAFTYKRTSAKLAQHVTARS